MENYRYENKTAAICRNCEKATQEMINGLCPKCYKQQDAEAETTPEFKEAPLGLIPQNYFEDGRISDILGAVARCMDAGYQIPFEWIKEYNEIAARRQERRGKRDK